LPFGQYKLSPQSGGLIEQDKVGEKPVPSGTKQEERPVYGEAAFRRSIGSGFREAILGIHKASTGAEIPTGRQGEGIFKKPIRHSTSPFQADILY